MGEADVFFPYMTASIIRSPLFAAVELVDDVVAVVNTEDDGVAIVSAESIMYHMHDDMDETDFVTDSVLKPVAVIFDAVAKVIDERIVAFVVVLKIFKLATPVSVRAVIDALGELNIIKKRDTLDDDPAGGKYI